MNQIFLKNPNSVAFRNVPTQQVSAEHTVQNNTLPEVEIPDLYYTPDPRKKEKSFKEKVKQWDMFNVVYPWLTHPLLMLGACGAMSYGVDKFAEACGGEYNKSIVGRAANLGDNITNSEFVKSKPIQTVLGWGKSAKNGIAKIFKNSDLIHAIKDTPSKPEWPMVKDELLSMEQRIVRDFTEITTELKLTENGAVELNKLSLGKKEKEFLKNFFSNNKVSDEVKSNALQLKNLGLEDDAIKNIINTGNATNTVKEATLKKLGLTAENVGMDIKQYLEKLKSGKISKDDVKLIREACDKARGISICDGYKEWLGPLQIFKRKMSTNEVANRLVSMDKEKTSKLGRMFSTLLQKCHRGFTFGGGKMMVLFMVTPFLVDTIIDVKKADKNEKAGTAAHGLVHSMSWVFTFPLALKIMHHLGGAQYAGMSPDKVKEYRSLIKAFNKDVAEGTFANHDAYKVALKELKGKLNGLKVNEGQTLITKTCKKLGSFLTMDLENVAAYQGSNKIMNMVRKIPSFFRNLGGVPMRFAIWAGISMGVLDTIINKCIKGLFGNYYDRIKDEEQIANKEEQKIFTKEDLQARLLNAQRQKVYGMNPEFTQANTSQTTDPQETTVAMKGKTKPQQTFQTNAQNNIFTQPVVIEPTEVNNFTIEPNGTVHKTENKENSMQIQSTRVVPQTMPTYNYIPNKKNIVQEPAKRKIDNYTYIPSSKNVIKPETKDNKENKYIPSQMAANIPQTFDNSGLDAALKRADRAEKKAIQTLAGNFNGL